MKRTKRFALIASTLLCLALFASASFATNPLNIPRGLAVDAKGNLWVANAGTNSILAFNPGYKQLTADTITAGVSEPTGVAFDSLGNLWVSNYEPASVTEYTNGVQDTGSTITGIPAATALAIDGLDNLWVVNSPSVTGVPAYLNVYEPTQVYGSPTHLQVSFGPYGAPFYGIAVSDGALVWGNASALNFAPATQSITSGAIAGVSVGGNNTATYLASDSNGTIYFATTENTVNYAVPSTFGSATQLIELSFPPAGIAVDSVRGRIYISSGYENSIVVYNTSGTLLHTIK